MATSRNSSPRLSFRVTPQVHEQLAAIARANSVELSDVLRAAIFRIIKKPPGESELLKCKMVEGKPKKDRDGL